MFTFNPLTDEEIDNLNIIPEGVYNFEVVKCEHKPSKSGNPMAVLTLKVWDNNGGVHFVFDNLVFAQVGLCIRHIKHFCETTGMLAEYQAGKLPDDLTGKCGKVAIGIQEEMPNPKGGMYPRKNIVVDYVVMPKETGKLVASSPIENGFDDQIPF